VSSDENDPTRRALRSLPPTAPGSYRVTVVAGVDTGASIELDVATPTRALVGQSPVCALRLSDPTVSRRHFSLEVTARGLHLSDLGSTNGTFVSGVLVGEVWLRGGEDIRLGDTQLHVEQVGARAYTLADSWGLGSVIGASTAMRRLYPLCERLAATEVTLVIEGETGTGKECLAEAIHSASRRAAAPFVVFDCTAVAPNLIESELFGHERGAFTGSVGLRRGVFERAQHGTLFIDEVGDLPLALQPKLLRAIERGQLVRVGGEEPMQVDVRIISATRRDLDREVYAGRFRDDLFHRLTVARIELPPLRERLGDVTLLAAHFAAQLGADPSALPAELLGRWEDAPWPGNVRELRNAVMRYLALGELATKETARTHRASPASGDVVAQILAEELPWSDARERMVDAFEARYVRDMLSRHAGNVTRAAAAAGIARRYFHRLKARHVGSDDDESK